MDALSVGIAAAEPMCMRVCACLMVVLVQVLLIRMSKEAQEKEETYVCVTDGGSHDSISTEATQVTSNRVDAKGIIVYTQHTNMSKYL